MIESVLTLKEELDFDADLQMQLGTTNITLKITCDQSSHTLHVSVVPINEFPPYFFARPYNITIPENNQIGGAVFEVKSKLRDYDIPTDAIQEFRLDQYLISQYDGRRYFAINSSTGVIASRNTIDYDTMGRTKFLMLKIVAVDVDGQEEFTTLNITIMDVDDLPPRFLRKQCDDVTTTCDVTIYTAEIDRHFQGSLDVRPVHVSARDGDVGLNYDVTYTIEPDDGVVDINNFTGVLTVTSAFENVKNMTSGEILTLTFNIMATESSKRKRNASVPLTLRVFHEFPMSPPTFPSTTAPAKENGDNDNSLILVIEITVPCVVVVVVCVCLIVFLVRHRLAKASQTKYAIKEVEKSRSLHRRSISMLSSTPINPYDLARAYPKLSIDVISEETEKPLNDDYSKLRYSLNDYADVTDTLTPTPSSSGMVASQEISSENGGGGDVTESTTTSLGQLYSVVDKRKQREKIIGAMCANAADVVDSTTAGVVDCDVTGYEDVGVGRYIVDGVNAFVDSDGTCNVVTDVESGVADDFNNDVESDVNNEDVADDVNNVDAMSEEHNVGNESMTWHEASNYNHDFGDDGNDLY
ncbi:protocadherin gamma-A3-like isoform X1 [Dreissena polymorpha]|uniref:protocadherin gamma-A3-like isoform X1 n=1 Tax=Dreissena polymorpha TaxID=45954 RepID=UPI0022647F4E|nr:protocadherin gamma-A3-like isoform X1 [Dreissena polymorpha]